MTQPAAQSNRKKLRVLMLLENAGYPADRRVVNEAVELARRGHDVTVICPTRPSGRSSREVIEGIRVYRYPAPHEFDGILGYVWEYGLSLLMIGMLTAWVFVRHGFDVIHAHNPPDLLFLVAAPFRLVGKRFVFDHHDLSPEMYQAIHHGQGRREVFRALSFFERCTCRTANHLIATNESYKRVVVERHGIDPSRVTIVRNVPPPIMLENHAPDPQLAGRAETVLVYVGFIGHQDGVDQLLRALAALRDDFHRTDFHCVVIGKGAAVGRLQRLAAELELGGLVCFAGYATGTALWSKMAAADIFVAPEPSNSYTDRSTMIKLMEYMCFGKPIVAYDLPEHRVTGGDAVAYAAPNDLQDLARKICLLMDDPPRCSALGALARERARQHFLWQPQGEKLAAVYERFANKA